MDTLSPKSKIILHLQQKMNEQEFKSLVLELKECNFSELCDAVLESSDGKLFSVSKYFMSAISPYFRALFCNSLQSQEDVSVVSLPDMDSECLSILVDFAHGLSTSNIIAKTSIEEVVKVMDRFMVERGIKECQDFMMFNLCVSNCLFFWRLSSLYWIADVNESCLQLLLYNFLELPESLRTSLTIDELKVLLQDDRLNIKREEETYKAISKWIQADHGNRKQYLPQLIKFVRFGNSAVSFIQENLLEKGIIHDFPAVLEYLVQVDEVLRDIQGNPIPSKFDIKTYPFLRPRIPRDIIFAFGGWSANSATNFLETYDIRVNKWYETPVPEVTKRAYHGMVYLQGLIYFVGGFDGQQYFSSVSSFNPVSGVWTEKGNLSRARCYVSCAVLDGMIYACGGYDGVNRTDACERYDPMTNQWTPIPSMNFVRSDACASVLDGKLYVVGGFDGSEVLASVEVFDPKSLTWTPFHRMLRPRSGVQATAHDGYLYVFGGNDGFVRQTSCEKYDPLRGIWTQIKDMDIPRSNFACVSVEGLIYIIGGFNGQTTINDVEAYDPERDAWLKMWPMEVARRSALSACIVSGLPNAVMYTWLRREILEKNQVQDNQEDAGDVASDPGQESSPVARRTRRQTRNRG